MIRSLCFVAVSGMLAGEVRGGDVRTWTDRNGRTATAEFVELDGEDVILKSDGQTYRVPLADLCPQDRVRAQMESRMQQQPPPRPPEPEPTEPERPPYWPHRTREGTPAQGSPSLDRTDPQTLNRPPGQSGWITCPNCGRSLDPRKAQNDRCTYCGAPLGQAPPANPAPEPDGGGLTPEDQGALAGIGMLLFIFVLWKWSQR